jgi:signal peptidase I
MGPGAAQSAGKWIKAFAVGRRPQWTVARIVVLVLVTFFLFKYVILLRRIESVSMLPTFHEGSIHVINRLAYLGGRRPQRGDIVAIRTSGETVMYVKRIIGLPGETIELRDGTVLINGQALEEPYLFRKRRRDWDRLPLTLGANEYYVIGDNRTMSFEQHELGAVAGHRIAGKVVW